MTTQTLRQRRALFRMCARSPNVCPWWLIPLLCVCVVVVWASIFPEIS